MKRFTKFALSVFVVALILGLSFLLADIDADIDIIPAVSAAEIVDSGSCGDNVTYTLDSEGTLTISGTGDMENVFAYIGSPWRSLRENIKKVIISKGVTRIGDYAFDDCDNLKSVTIPDSVKKIGLCAFRSCSGLESISIPDSVISIAVGAFESCRSLKSVHIKDLTKWLAIKFWCDSANPLYNNADLYVNGEKVVDVIIPDSVTTIRDYAFAGCGSLQSITMSESVTSIGECAFCACTSLKSVYIKDLTKWLAIKFWSVSSNGWGNYHACSNPLWNNADLYVNGEKVTDIIIPDSVTSIGNCAFAGYDNLQSVTIGEGVTSIGEDAFFGCSSLQSVTIGKGVTSIGEDAFYDCNSLKSVYIKDLAKWLAIKFGSAYYDGWGDYHACSNPLWNNADLYVNGEKVTDIIIPDSVTSIGNCAFAGYDNLQSVTIGEGVTSIGEDAFYDCNSLKSVYIKDLAKWLDIVFENNYSNPLIDGNADLYLNGEKVTDVIIPDSVTTIGFGAFYGCSSLQSVVIPDSVTSIGEDAFCGCFSLQDIVIPDSVTSIGDYAFLYCVSLQNVTIPDSVTSIGEHAFEGCSSLKNVIIGDGVRYIYRFTFSGCVSLQSVSIPESVTYLGTDIFNGCSNLSYVCYAGSENQWESILKEEYEEDDKLDDITIHFNCTQKHENDNFVMGDLDGDGQITATDARLALRAAVGLENFNDVQKKSADADGDSQITAADARLILRASVGLEDPKAWMK